MDAIATTIAIGVALYVAAGLVTAVAFVTSGVTAVQSAPVTVGARILLLPGGDRAVAARALPLAQGTSSAMRRTHRTAHRMLWPALAVLVGIALAMSLAMRAPPPAPAPPAAVEGQR